MAGLTTLRKIDEEALARATQAGDLPDTVVRGVVERYLRELWITALLKNKAVVALTKLRPGGDGIPWDRAQQRRNECYYLQTADAVRARVLLNDPLARWQVFHSRQRLSAGADHDIMVRRLPNKS